MPNTGNRMTANPAQAEESARHIEPPGTTSPASAQMTEEPVSGRIPAINYAVRTSILRALCSSRLGMRSANIPSFMLASAFPPSSSLLRAKLRW